MAPGLFVALVSIVSAAFSSVFLSRSRPRPAPSLWREGWDRGPAGYIRRAPATVEQSAGRQEEEKREGEEYFPPSWNQSGSGEVHGDEDWRWRIGG